MVRRVVVIYQRIFADQHRASFIAGARHRARLACTTGDSVKRLVGEFRDFKVFKRFALLDFEFLAHAFLLSVSSTITLLYHTMRAKGLFVSIFPTS